MDGREGHVAPLAVGVIHQLDVGAHPQEVRLAPALAGHEAHPGQSRPQPEGDAGLGLLDDFDLARRGQAGEHGCQPENLQPKVASAHPPDQARSHQQIALVAGGEGQQGEIVRALAEQLAHEGHRPPIEGHPAQGQGIAGLDQPGGLAQAHHLIRH